MAEFREPVQGELGRLFIVSPQVAMKVMELETVAGAVPEAEMSAPAMQEATVQLQPVWPAITVL